MGKLVGLSAQLKDDIESSVYGTSGERFLSARELAVRLNVSLDSAVKLLSELSETRLVKLVGKHYYITNGYAPPSSPLGGLLRKSRRKLFGMILNNIESPFFTSLAKCLHEYCAKAGYILIISDSGGYVERETEILDELSDIGVAGVFACPGLAAELVDVYARYPLALVTLGRDLALANCDAVMVDNYQAGVQVAKHLCAAGCRSFAYLGLNDYIRADPRIAGFRDGLTQEGFALADSNIATVKHLPGGTFDTEPLSGLIRTILREAAESQTLPVGIFCYHDLLAVEVERAVKRFSDDSRKKKLLIPEDVMIVGFDDLSAASIVTPPLTTISYRYRLIAERAFEVMLDYCDNPAHEVGRYVVQSSLTVRASTR